jgi:type II secretory ATPase GspE/PulE/Tfp pilus assembly ATPase PilB-like protein
LTGHLVFSTLHTNDAAGAVPRLINMGQEPFLVASSLRAIIGQALIRVSCTACREAYTPSPETIERAGLPTESIHGTFLRGAGCAQCGKTGFRGRVGVYELMEVTPTIARLIMKRANSQDLLESAMAEGMTTMRQDGVAKAMRGLTTLEEVVQLT